MHVISRLMARMITPLSCRMREVSMVLPAAADPASRNSRDLEVHIQLSRGRVEKTHHVGL